MGIIIGKLRERSKRVAEADSKRKEERLDNQYSRVANQLRSYSGFLGFVAVSEAVDNDYTARLTKQVLASLIGNSSPLFCAVYRKSSQSKRVNGLADGLSSGVNHAFSENDDQRSPALSRHKHIPLSEWPMDLAVFGSIVRDNQAYIDHEDETIGGENGGAHFGTQIFLVPAEITDGFGFKFNPADTDQLHILEGVGSTRAEGLVWQKQGK